jgi:hypothetical protein
MASAIDNVNSYLLDLEALKAEIREDKLTESKGKLLLAISAQELRAVALQLQWQRMMKWQGQKSMPMLTASVSEDKEHEKDKPAVNPN